MKTTPPLNDALLTRIRDWRREGAKVTSMLDRLSKEDIAQDVVALHIVAAFELSDRAHLQLCLWQRGSNGVDKGVEREFARKRFKGEPTLERVADFYEVSKSRILEIVNSINLNSQMLPYSVFDNDKEVYRGYVLQPEALAKIDKILLPTNPGKVPWWSW